MSLNLVSLKFISIRNIHGDSFGPDEVDEDSAFQARFGLSIEVPEDQESENFEFLVGQRFEAILPAKKDEPFFKIEIVGHFSTSHQGVIADWIDTPEGAYALGATLFPYLRGYAKPLLEGLGASQIDFPWSTPPIAKVGTRKEKRPTKRRSSASKS